MKCVHTVFAALIACLTLPGTGLPQQTFTFTQIVKTPDQLVGVEVLKVAFARLDIPLQFKFYPGARALESSSRGEADGEIHRIWEIGEKYPTLKRVPTPINFIETVGFAKKGSNISIERCADLQSYKVVIVRGIKHTEHCSAGAEALTVSTDGESMMKFLARGRADIALDAGFNGFIQLKKLGLETSVEPLAKALNTSLLYTYLHEKHSAFIPTLDSEFQKMAKSGEISAIREKVVQKVLANPDAHR